MATVFKEACTYADMLRIPCFRSIFNRCQVITVVDTLKTVFRNVFVIEYDCYWNKTHETLNILLNIINIWSFFHMAKNNSSAWPSYCRLLNSDRWN